MQFFNYSMKDIINSKRQHWIKFLFKKKYAKHFKFEKHIKHPQLYLFNSKNFLTSICYLFIIIILTATLLLSINGLIFQILYCIKH